MTQPQPRTVDDVAAPYANFLDPIPFAEVGTACQDCRRGVTEGYQRCYVCSREALGVGRGGADVVVPIALAPAESQLARALVNYKRAATSAGVRTKFTVDLAAVLWKWLAQHERCMGMALGIGDTFPIITTVPSSSSERVGVHPLVRLVSGIVAESDKRYEDLLEPTGQPMGARDFRADRFRSRRRVGGSAVLLIDDTWTTGAKIHGAAAALKAAGAGEVAAVAIGRWYHPTDERNAGIEKLRRRRQWSWDTCAIEE